MSATRERPNAGFLLVEALATMAISAFLLVALASLVSLTLRASDRITEAGSNFERSSRVMSALSREIMAIAPYRWAAPGAGFIFSGTADRIVFAVARGPADEVVMLQSGTRNGVADLVMNSAALVPDGRSAADLAFGDPQEFYRGAASIRFAYIGRGDDGREFVTDGWARPDRMPIAIRVSMIEPSSGRTDSTLRIPLRIDAEPGCAAPGRGPCAFIKKDADGDTVDAEGKKVDDAPIDPNDALGWRRYGLQ